MQRFYQKTPLTLADAQAELLAVIRGEDPTLIHLALMDGRPFGQVQCYLIMETPSYAEEIGVSDGVGMDYFIGEPELRGHGLGRAMLEAYLADILFPAFPGERRCVVCYETANEASGGVLRSLGFLREKDLIEGGVPSTMMILERPL